MFNELENHQKSKQQAQNSLSAMTEKIAEGDELSDEDLEAVAGGAGNGNTGGSSSGERGGSRLGLQHLAGGQQPTGRPGSNRQNLPNKPDQNSGRGGGQGQGGAGGPRSGW